VSKIFFVEFISGFFDVLQPNVSKKGRKIATGMRRKEISVQSLRKPGL